LKIGELNPIVLIASFGIFIGIVAFVILEQQGQRRIPIQHAKKVIGRKVYSAQATHLPLKINPSGVIPIIFASSVLLFPAQIAQTLGDIGDKRAIKPLEKVYNEATNPLLQHETAKALNLID